MSLHLENYAKIFEQIYGDNKTVINYQISRYQNIEKLFNKYFKSDGKHYFSAPGRVEIGGNHTDHNNGRVLAAAINLDMIAIASPTRDEIVTIYSRGYNKPFIVDLKDKRPNNKEAGTTNALIRGIASRMDDLGETIGGFNAVISSDIPVGSGISSSASIEVLLGSIFNHLHNGSTLAPEVIAKIGQFAENIYFGKPCGLMDQLACATGGIISIDFENPAIPLIKKIRTSFVKYNHRLLLVDTGGDHVDLTAEYASIPDEMKLVAETMGSEICRELRPDEFSRQIPQLRKVTGDRAILRVLHFFNENERVRNQVLALEMRDFDRFIQYVNDSGNSSFKWLQNIYSAQNSKQQGVSLALALTEEYINQIKAGACRIHGGGFAGTILVIIPEDCVENYKLKMQPVFGENCVLQLEIRQNGTIYLNNLLK